MAMPNHCYATIKCASYENLLTTAQTIPPFYYKTTNTKNKWEMGM